AWSVTLVEVDRGLDGGLGPLEEAVGVDDAGLPLVAVGGDVDEGRFGVSADGDEPDAVPVVLAEGGGADGFGPGGLPAPHPVGAVEPPPVPVGDLVEVAAAPPERRRALVDGVVPAAEVRQF